LERIEKLGSIGDVVTVKDGFARNYLLPNKKALRANDANRKVFEANRERIEADNAERRGEAQKTGETVDGAEITLIRASSNSGQLYGSVNVRDIAEALQAQGHDVNKAQIVLERPIKTLGVVNVRVQLHPEVQVTVKANVARSDDEAELQRQGVDVFGQAVEDDRAEGEGFTEAFDPNAEPGEFPAEDAAAEEPVADEPAADEPAADEPAAEGDEPAEG
ncbi:MAG: 50S ribosomal protein L9, partial [Croceibacterium sp.]